jgi:dephospho-CoA kinase
MRSRRGEERKNPPLDGATRQSIRPRGGYEKSMKVLGTVGLPGSGKGEAAAVAREVGVPVVTMGDVIRQACRDRGLDPSEHHGAVATALREEEGEAAIAERSLPLIEDALDDAEAVLVDGLRSPAEADRFEAAFGDDFVLVSIEAPFETRAERLTNRGRDDSDVDHEALREREERELGFGMGDVMDRADVTVENTGSLDAFQERIRDLLAVEVER